ncbi:hypothetical protein NDU88_000034 [Pleurodeles waltl]|uniref:Uncharacterized protein n=1 Tax=Pleurodeles waltl TaxID=8319 RepID=A0AAV7VSA7_PLEWA|nr:hypothetical protein NDU88_000034 [Pleurodeles waltl]
MPLLVLPPSLLVSRRRGIYKSPHHPAVVADWILTGTLAECSSSCASFFQMGSQEAHVEKKQIKATMSGLSVDGSGVFLPTDPPGAEAERKRPSLGTACWARRLLGRGELGREGDV